MNIFEAIEAADHSTIKTMVRNGLDLNKPEGNELPIFKAADKKDIKTIELLIDLGADPELSINNGPNTYDILSMGSEIRMGVPSPEMRSTINRLKNKKKKDLTRE